MTWMAEPEAWLALATLATLEVVLGVDNIVMLIVLTGRLPAAQQIRARRVGLVLALALRILLLLSLTWLLGLNAPLFELWATEFSGRDLILIGGGCSWWRRGRTRFTPRRKAPGVTTPPVRPRPSAGCSPRSGYWISCFRSTP